jgi:hypothetical protein
MVPLVRTLTTIIIFMNYNNKIMQAWVEMMKHHRERVIKEYRSSPGRCRSHDAARPRRDGDCSRPSPPVRKYGDVMGPDTQPNEDLVNLCRCAFKDYGVRAWWSMRPVDDPTPAEARAITPALRTYGGMDGRRLAEHLERVCRAAP